MASFDIPFIVSVVNLLFEQLILESAEHPLTFRDVRELLEQVSDVSLVLLLQFRVVRAEQFVIVRLVNSFEPPQVSDLILLLSGIVKDGNLLFEQSSVVTLLG